MSGSLQAFLNGSIDYAGLFPPARLPLDEAMRNYARHRREADSWMLGRFVCPATRLGELAPFLADPEFSETPLAIAALGKMGTTLQECVDHLRDDLGAVRSFRQQYPAQVSVDALEVRLPTDVLDFAMSGELDALIQGADDFLTEEEAWSLVCYFEIVYGAEWFYKVPVLIGALGRDPRRMTGMKVRCGGEHANTIPPPDDVAFAVAACRAAGVPIKFTAGLHHPIRHFDDALQTQRHGFINVLGAGILAQTLDSGNIHLEMLEEIVADEDAGHFMFDDDAFRWKGHRMTVEQIITARAQVVSFGSCSFDEPCADLRELGWLT
jgi:hypothetical protein